MLKKCSLLWLDLEMTGLNADVDVILEIAVIATDINLETVIEGPVFTIHQPEDQLALMIPWVRNLHTKSGLLQRVETSKVSVHEAEKEVLEFVRDTCDKDFYLAGNSIYQDRTFLKRYMPTLHEKAHYRVVDVSSLKVLIEGWYPHSPESSFKKSKAHRALEDVRESIAELKHYRKFFFKSHH